MKKSTRVFGEFGFGEMGHNQSAIATMSLPCTVSEILSVFYPKFKEFTRDFEHVPFGANVSHKRVDGGDLHGVSQSSVSRCANAVANALNRHASQFIRFPTDEASQRHIKAEFCDIAGFPKVVDVWMGHRLPLLLQK